ncbi:MAG: ABC transporter permease [Oscillospiraceae bacterium]|nr:ABC transporter permease [Oscillospiraceae bacterium]MDE7171094.1 ABC transporter permease [Oscillospiraceae bacterium]
MFNYIRAEFYKLVRRKYTYIALGVFLALEGLLVACYAFHNAHSYATPFGGAIPIVVEMGAVGFCICLLTADIVFAGQYKNSTLKNEVSFGLSRTQIYLGKLIAQTLLSIAYLMVMMGFFLGACAIILPLESGAAFYSASEALSIVGWFLTAGLPLWIGVQAAACMCQFLINGDMASSFVYVGIVFVLDGVLELIGLLVRGRVGDILFKICAYLPRPMLDSVKSTIGNWNDMGRAWLVGAFWLAACTAVGLYGFNRKEIK